MQVKSNIKNRIVFPGLAVFIGFFMLCSSVYAGLVEDRPDWWEVDIADAMVVFDGMPMQGTTGSEILAAGTAKFEYDYSTFSWIGGGSFDNYLFVNLGNQWNPTKIKKIWIGYETVGDIPLSPLMSITGYHENGETIEAMVINDYYDESEKYGFIEAIIAPQPDRETFLFHIASINTNDPQFDFSIDYLEIGTKCVVPIPSALVLLGGGLIGLVGLRRRKLN